ncbi:hypothetical protein EI94DRAFT_1582579, partial [Lactarius quietus]
KIMEYRSMKVCYESKVDWQQYLDYAYCSPCFHGRERRDFVILKTTDSFIFMRLAFIFTCSRLTDLELRLHRLRGKNSMEFFFVNSIVRSAPVVQDFSKPGDYFVMDVIDHSGDMFIRCNEIF